MTATYRASLTLTDEEMEKTYTFERGILLHQDYALISSDGNFVDGTIQVADGELDIVYTRAAAEIGWLERRIPTDTVHTGEQIAAVLRFDRPISVEEAAAAETVLRVEQTLTGADGVPVSRTLTLQRDSLSTDRTKLTFIAAIETAYAPGTEVTYTMLSTAVEYTGSGRIRSVADGLAINPAVSDVLPMTFNTSAAITSAVLRLDGGFGAASLKPTVEVLLNTLADETSFKGTSLKVIETATAADGAETEIERTLTFDRLEPYEQDGETYHKALYSSGGDKETLSWPTSAVGLHYAFSMPGVILASDGEPSTGLLSYDRNITIHAQIPQTAEQDTTCVRAYAASAVLKQTALTESTVPGSALTLDVTFSAPLAQPIPDGLTVSLLRKEAGKADTTVILNAARYDAAEKVLVFSGTDSVYTGGVAVTYAMPGTIGGTAVLLDENRVPAGIALQGLTSLELDNVQGTVTDATFDFAAITEENGMPVLRVTYGMPVAEEGFAGSTVPVRITAATLEAENAAPETTVDFAYAGISEDGKTVLYTYQAPLQMTAVRYTYTPTAGIPHEEPLMSADGTMLLTDTLPADAQDTYERPLIDGVTLVNRNPRTSVLSMEQTDLHIHFTKPLASLTEAELKELSAAIELTVTLTDGTMKTLRPTYTGDRMQDAQTLVLRCDSRDVLKDVKTVTFKVASMALEQPTGDRLFDKVNTGIHANGVFAAGIDLQYKAPDPATGREAALPAVCLALLCAGTLLALTWIKRQKRYAGKMEER